MATSQCEQSTEREQQQTARFWHRLYGRTRTGFVAAIQERGDEVTRLELVVTVPVSFTPACLGAAFVLAREEDKDEVLTVFPMSCG